LEIVSRILLIFILLELEILLEANTAMLAKKNIV